MRILAPALATAFVITALAPAPSMAQNASIIAYPPQNDTVSMTLSAEDWVDTHTARTEIGIDAAMPGADAGKARGDMLAAVKNLAAGAEWRFTRFDRSQDASGLEHWQAALEARLPEAQLGGLADRAKQASKPGMQLRVDAVDFTPTLAETEAVRTKVRAELYKKINDALAQLNQAEPDRKFRIQAVHFGEQVSAPVMTARKEMAVQGFMPSAPAPAEPGLALSEKVRLTASVSFAAHAPAP